MRHVRHAKRTLSRTEQLARNLRKRGPEPEPVTAPPTRTKPPATAPFDPVTVPVRKLAAALDGIDDASVVRALRDADPRTTAADKYAERLEALGDG